jgi:hypothetical protein
MYHRVVFVCVIWIGLLLLLLLLLSKSLLRAKNLQFD